MQIHSIGIDLGKTTFHLVALGSSRQGAGEEEVHSEAVAGLHREHADFADRPGSLLGRSLPRPGTAQAGP